MSRRARTAARPRTATRLLTAGALVALGTVSTVTATASEAPRVDGGAGSERVVSVTPADRIEPVSIEGDALTTAMFAALDARAELDAQAPPPPEPEPAPEPASTPEPAAEPAPADRGTSAGVWDRLAQCESGGNWSINTGNGYYGGIQFSLQSWQAVGGSGLPHEASKATQIEMGERLKDIQGWNAWPSCARQLGLI